MSDVGHGILLFSYATTTVDMWVTGISAQVQNAPYTKLHHLILSTDAGEDPECPGTQIKKDFIAIGQDTPSTFTFEKPYAMFVPKGTVLEMSTMIHNPKEENEKGTTYFDVEASLTLTGTYAPPNSFKNIELMRIAVQDTPYCDKDPRGPGFSVPAHSQIFEKKPNITGKDRGRIITPYSGTIVSGYGHLHGWDGGKSVTLYVNKEKVHTWETAFLSAPGEDGREWHTPWVPMNIRFEKGDELSVASVYTNPSDHDEENAMGAARLFFVKD